MEVAKAINSLTFNTPLFGCAGDIPANASVGMVDGGGGTASDNNNNNSSMTDLVITNDGNNANSKDSYAAIHLALHRKNKLYHDKYTEHILTYAAEWERILTTRISGHLKQSETLRVNLDHYAKKVEDLHKTINKTMTKGRDDAGVDVGLVVGSDVGIKVGLEAGVDVGLDDGVDVSSVVRSDVGLDVGVALGFDVGVVEY